MTMVVIVGGGPAGMSTALWLRNFGIACRILEADRNLGGMEYRNLFPLKGMLGHPASRGRDLSVDRVGHIVQAGIPYETGSRVTTIERTASGFLLKDGDAFENHRSWSADYVVLAAGTTFRGEDELRVIPGFAEARDRIVFGPTSLAPSEPVAARRITIVGGGDNAFDVADMLAVRGIECCILSRGTPKAQPLLQQRVADHVASGRVRILAGTHVSRLDRTEQVLIVETNKGVRIHTDLLATLIGYRSTAPSFAWRETRPPLSDSKGYLLIDREGRTDLANVFAAGDVANPDNPCVPTALAAGSVVAQAIRKQLADRR